MSSATNDQSEQRPGSSGTFDIARDWDVPISTQIYWQIAYQIDSGEGEEYTLAWDDFDLKFEFNPSTRKKDWPGIKEPNPSLTFRISHIFGNGEEYYNSLHDNLIDVLLQSFISLVPKYGWIFAVDWQHECYKFYPHQLNEYGEWMVPILPDGDYHIFFEKKLDFGVLGHPWEGTMCIFGEDLIVKIEQNRPSLFTEIIRVNGKTA